MNFQDRTLQVNIHRDQAADPAGPEVATYQLLAGDAFETSHHGKPVRIEVGDDVTLPIPPPPDVPPVTQPAGRAPRRRT
jgi:alpha,alpha-trehalose phosphorylase